MSNSIVKIETFKNPYYNTFTAKSRWAKWAIEVLDDEDITIICQHEHGSDLLILNQEELKQLIVFLNTLVKNDKRKNKKGDNK